MLPWRNSAMSLRHCMGLNTSLVEVIDQTIQLVADLGDLIAATLQISLAGYRWLYSYMATMFAISGRKRSPLLIRMVIDGACHIAVGF